MPDTQQPFSGFTAIRDRREHPRRIVALNYVKLADGNGGIMMNLSEGGLAFTAAEPLAADFIPRLSFRLSFHLEDEARTIEASGRVVWLNDSKKGAGIQFVDMAEEDREQIHRWVSLKISPEPARIFRKSWQTQSIALLHEQGNHSPANAIDSEIPPQLRQMFPSESASPQRAPVQTDGSTGSSIFSGETTVEGHPAQRDESFQPQEPPRSEPAQSNPSARPPVETNEPRETRLPPRVARVPHFGYQAIGYQQEDDWTRWVDPASARTPRKLGSLVLGIFLVLAGFAVGALFGGGSLDGFLESVRARMPDKFRAAPNSDESASVPAQAVSPAANPSSSAVDASSQVQRPDAATPPASAEAAAATTTEPLLTTSTDEKAKDETSQADEPSPKVAASNRVRKEPQTPPQEDGASVLVAPTGAAGSPFRLTTPETPVSASSSLAISSQTSVLVPREGVTESSARLKRLRPGALIFHVDPQTPRGFRPGEIELVKLRATVAEDGRVIDVQRISGPAPLASAAMSAVREWKYSPTLLDGRAVKAEEKITMAFRAR